ncbi:MAG: hypothetical protein QN122_03140 [Armatimonadota bacterium]|nr:hypothetical protein [Armatimonadota bacterium]MDR7447746.1 hypothetical protein [Armatimonadota bacterium]MDR7458523.1 hypothetical protein [Armatimonadota bacterium]MDR7479920.1 hypothetical protein [Armatimonadota bacterium]MDR7487732.1 hypothetical protein [Armatimonadota bacterium]
MSKQAQTTAGGSPAQVYADLWLKATEQWVDEALTVRERLSAIAAQALTRTRELAAKEGELALDVLEAWQAQAQVATRRLAKVFGVPSVG